MVEHADQLQRVYSSLLHHSHSHCTTDSLHFHNWNQCAVLLEILSDITECIPSQIVLTFELYHCEEHALCEVHKEFSQLVGHQDLKAEEL